MRCILMNTLVLLLLAYGTGSYAQGKFTLSGYAKDAANGEALVGASVFVKESNAGVVTNVYGFYSITLPAGNYNVEISYIGYDKQTHTVALTGNVRLDAELVTQSNQLQELVVTADEEERSANVKSLEMSTNKLDIKTIQKIPAFMGEVDVIKSLQLLPGVSTVGEGASGFNVRGGSVGQNLILLDEAPVYNSSHLLGFFSVFNPDAVKDTKLYKGAVPARYGGRLASLLDVRMKEGNSKEFEANGGIGTIFSRLAVEAPINKGKGSFIVAGRRSYIDILARPFVDVLSEGGALNFYDVTAKGNYTLNERNRLYISGYAGRDNFKFDKDQGFDWGNKTATVRLNHLFNDRLFANVTGVYSSYDYALAFGDDDRDRFKWNSKISNVMFKPDFTYFIDSDNELNFGVEAIYYTFTPAKAQGVSDGDVIDISLEKKYNLEASVYIGNTQKLGSKLALEYGVRLSHFEYFGPGTIYTYNDTIPGRQKHVISEKQYKRGESVVNYTYPEPRVSAKYQLSDQASIKGSYNRMVQYLHLISNTTASNPLDIWTPSSQLIKPEIGDQFTLGYFRNLGGGMFEASVEGYYRATQNQVDYIDGASLLLNKYLEGDLLSGKGRAYGVEFYLQKRTGRFTGWMSYTLGRTELQVEGINNGEWYPARYDQTHNLKLAGFYTLTKRWSVSADFVFTTGTPTTFPTSRYVVQGVLIPYNANGSRNNVRLQNYNRLDVSFRLEGKEFKKNGKPRKNHDYFVFSVYNVYARRNSFSVYFSQSDDRMAPSQPLQSEATKLSIIGSMVPAISYNFNF